MRRSPRVSATVEPARATTPCCDFPRSGDSGGYPAGVALVPMVPRRSRDQRGQTLVLFVVFLFVLMGAAAIVVDLGYWYVTKRQAQATADAVALAAAADLPDASVATSDSSGYRLRNNWQGTVDLS